MIFIATVKSSITEQEIASIVGFLSAKRIYKTPSNPNPSEADLRLQQCALDVLLNLSTAGIALLIPLRH